MIPDPADTFSIASLFSLGEKEAAAYGGKSVSLARLRACGLAVPEGVALSFAENSDVTADQVLQALHFWRETFGEIIFPLAVRSSAAGEDSSDHSFAGQLESYLGIRDAGELESAIRKCLESARSARVRSYRRHRGAGSGRVGVLLQRMVAADFAGVCFTRGLEDLDVLRLDAVRGLGDSLMAGKETPSQFAFQRHLRTLALVSDAQGVGDEFTSTLAIEIAEGCLAAERAFGFPLDVEWATENGKAFFLQARPLTHLRTEAEKEILRGREILRLNQIAARENAFWIDASIGDVLPNPSVLIVDSFQRASRNGGGIARAFEALGFRFERRADGGNLFEMIAGRIYLNASEYFATIKGGLPLKLVLKKAEPLAISLAWDRQSSWRERLCFPWRVIGTLLRIGLRALRVRKTLHLDFASRIEPALSRDVEAERAIDLRKLSDRDLGTVFLRRADKNQLEASYYHLLTDILAGLCHALLKAVLHLVDSRDAATAELDLTTGLEGNFNTETNLAVSDLARDRMTLEEFLARFGHRGNPDWDLAAPRWRDNPDRVLRMKRTLAASDVDARARFQAQKAKRVARERALEERIASRWLLRPFKRLLLAQLRYYQIYSPLREATQSLCFSWVELTRQVVEEMARRAQADDLLYSLTFAELETFFLTPDRRANLLEVAATRKRELRLMRSLPLPHAIHLENLASLGEIPRWEQKSGEQFLRGQIVCKGFSRARARVVENLDEAQDLEPGEILVAKFSDPAWTPLFLVAGGLVLEQGSSFSHGAIIAREYGLPALVNVAGATSRIKTGQKLVLDAENGTLSIEP